MFKFKILGDRRFFQDFSSNIYSFVLNLWNNFTEKFMNDVMKGSDSQIIQSNLENALLTLRILRKLTVFGFNSPNQNPDCVKFLKQIFDTAKMALQCRKLSQSSEKDVFYNFSFRKAFKG